MLAWLNENIGADGATYIGLILGIAALVYGGKLIKNKKVSQRAKVNSGTVIQVGGDLHSGNKNEPKS